MTTAAGTEQAFLATAAWPLRLYHGLTAPGHFFIAVADEQRFTRYPVAGRQQQTGDVVVTPQCERQNNEHLPTYATIHERPRRPFTGERDDVLPHHNETD